MPGASPDRGSAHGDVGRLPSSEAPFFFGGASWMVDGSDRSMWSICEFRLVFGVQIRY